MQRYRHVVRFMSLRSIRTRCQTHIGRWTVRNANVVVGKLLGLCLVQHAAVSKPDIALVPAHIPADMQPALMLLNGTCGIGAVLLPAMSSYLKACLFSQDVNKTIHLHCSRQKIRHDNNTTMSSIASHC